MKKLILIICDGMGDIPEPELGNMTPLESAKTPNMDRLAIEGVNGIIHVLGKGVRPNSDEAHLTLFGYEKDEFPVRGPIEAAGVGIKLEHGDVAIRANLGTVDEELKVKDRRAGRIETTVPFVEKLQDIDIEGAKFIVKAGTGHRISIVIRGEGLSDQISNSDVHYLPGGEVIEDWQDNKVNKIEPLDDTKEAAYTARVFQKFLEKAHEVLVNHPLNKEREKEGNLKGNYILTRYPGYYKKLTPFIEKYNLKAGCIAGAGLYKGLGSVSGMDIIEVEGATGLPNTNVHAKFQKAIEIIDDYDFLYVHVKPTDIYGENGDCEGKKKFIEEKIDPALTVFESFDGVISLTADHSTPCSHKDHSGDPVPLLIHGGNIKADDVSHFNERECKNGNLGEIYGKDFMNKLLELSN